MHAFLCSVLLTGCYGYRLLCALNWLRGYIRMYAQQRSLIRTEHARRCDYEDSCYVVQWQLLDGRLA